ncbi:MAG: RNA methyltransferase PUA domain-containing protein [Bacteroidales bacterium]|nr:RNA methyltransferase PUA domain-containing protein [Bacteroidales bacterium]
MHLFYTPDIHSALYTFDKDDSRHCSKVLRLKQGDRVTLTNGKGSFYHSEIIDDNPKATAVKVVEQEEVTRRMAAAYPYSYLLPQKCQPDGSGL